MFFDISRRVLYYNCSVFAISDFLLTMPFNLITAVYRAKAQSSQRKKRFRMENNPPLRWAHFYPNLPNLPLRTPRLTALFKVYAYARGPGKDWFCLFMPYNSYQFFPSMKSCLDYFLIRTLLSFAASSIFRLIRSSAPGHETISSMLR